MLFSPPKRKVKAGALSGAKAVQGPCSASQRLHTALEACSRHTNETTALKHRDYGLSGTHVKFPVILLLNCVGFQPFTRPGQPGQWDCAASSDTRAP